MTDLAPALLYYQSVTDLAPALLYYQSVTDLAPALLYYDRVTDLAPALLYYHRMPDPAPALLYYQSVTDLAPGLLYYDRVTDLAPALLYYHRMPDPAPALLYYQSVTDPAPALLYLPRAHLALGPVPRPGMPPWALIVRMFNYREKDAMLQYAGAHGPSRYEDKLIHIYPDCTRWIQDLFNGFPVVKRKHDIKYSLVFRARLGVQHDGKVHIYESAIFQITVHY
ncbi:hypothetical protein NDU88_000010 [Pleurodeles waltl]|uniref:Uncharacterized protein n=1 Tax=Pleurodeles waltl TaxID=8319 RepID=A0AAV7KSC8_PLEWA|nr:hypothetical protein NDU88_000010 [Pleurodeles waltl]